MVLSQYNVVRMSMLVLYKDSQSTTPAYIQPIIKIRRLGINQSYLIKTVQFLEKD
jgi:hypothetical protein